MAMAIDPETELRNAIAVLLIVRLLQIVGAGLALVGLFKGHWPESVLAAIFALAMGGQSPRPK
jgi:hypothetical protein